MECCGSEVQDHLFSIFSLVEILPPSPTIPLPYFPDLQFLHLLNSFLVFQDSPHPQALFLEDLLIILLNFLKQILDLTQTYLIPLHQNFYAHQNKDVDFDFRHHRWLDVVINTVSLLNYEEFNQRFYKPGRLL